MMSSKKKITCSNYKEKIEQESSMFPSLGSLKKIPIKVQKSKANLKSEAAKIVWAAFRRSLVLYFKPRLVVY